MTTTKPRESDVDNNITLLVARELEKMRPEYEVTRIRSLIYPEVTTGSYCGLMGIRVSPYKSDILECTTLGILASDGITRRRYKKAGSKRSIDNRFILWEGELADPDVFVKLVSFLDHLDPDFVSRRVYAYD